MSMEPPSYISYPQYHKVIPPGAARAQAPFPDGKREPTAKKSVFKSLQRNVVIYHMIDWFQEKYVNHCNNFWVIQLYCYLEHSIFKIFYCGPEWALSWSKYGSDIVKIYFHQFNMTLCLGTIQWKMLSHSIFITPWKKDFYWTQFGNAPFTSTA